MRKTWHFDDRCAYAAGPLRFNRFIRSTRFDLSRRHWIGQTIRGGFIRPQPDTYHLSMLREMVRCMLQLDFTKACRARVAGERVKFQLLEPDMHTRVTCLRGTRVSHPRP